MADESRIRTVLGLPDLAWLVERVRQRLERGDALIGTVQLQNPTSTQRSTFDRLLGRRPSSGKSIVVSLSQLDESIRSAGMADGLREAIEVLTGPIINVRAEQERVTRCWERIFEDANRRHGHREAIRKWLEDIRESGLLRRLARQDVDSATGLLDAAVQLVDRLPARDVPLAEFAASCTGDSHALDPGQPLATLVLRAAASLSQMQLTDTAEGRRDLWGSVGVVCDELSAPILVLNLRASPENMPGKALNLHADNGEPYRLSVRQLLRNPPGFDQATIGSVVFVCENPTVVAAAVDRLGTACAPLVCVEGQPKTAARLLLGHLRSAGIALKYHGDFDWAGVRIANQVIERHAATPWRMSAHDYRSAAGNGVPLSDTPVSPIWDDRLEIEMISAGVAVYEEMVLEPLLADLAGH